MSRSTIGTFQLFQKFPDVESARKYLESRLWPNGPMCPTCRKTDRITPRKDGFYRCNACKLDFTVRTGTIFERSHIPLHKWLYAMYLLVMSRKGISSLQLAREIGIRQASAWFLLHRLREACGSDLTMLRGIVEVDETFIGERLRALREKKNFSQGEIERRTGLLRAYISRVENGHTVPAIETLEKFARALEVPMDQLFYDGEKPPKLPNLPKRKNGAEIAWGGSGKNVRLLAKFRRLLSRTKATDQKLLLSPCERYFIAYVYHLYLIPLLLKCVKIAARQAFIATAHRFRVIRPRLDLAIMNL